jgi:hypothetical protein
VDFILAMHVVHEAPEARCFLRQLCDAMKAEGRLLLVEPKGHVRRPRFERILGAARDIDLVVVAEPRLRFNHAVLLARQPGGRRAPVSIPSPLNGYALL